MIESLKILLLLIIIISNIILLYLIAWRVDGFHDNMFGRLSSVTIINNGHLWLYPGVVTFSSDASIRRPVMLTPQLVYHILDECLLILTHINLAHFLVTDLWGNELALSRIPTTYLLWLDVQLFALVCVVNGVCMALLSRFEVRWVEGLANFAISHVHVAGEVVTAAWEGAAEARWGELLIAAVVLLADAEGLGRLLVVLLVLHHVFRQGIRLSVQELSNVSLVLLWFHLVKGVRSIVDIALFGTHSVQDTLVLILLPIDHWLEVLIWSGVDRRAAPEARSFNSFICYLLIYLRQIAFKPQLWIVSVVVVPHAHLCRRLLLCWW